MGPSVKQRGPLGPFSPGMGPPKPDIYLFLIFIFNCEFGALPKKFTKSDKFLTFHRGPGPLREEILDAPLPPPGKLPNQWYPKTLEPVSSAWALTVRMF